MTMNRREWLGLAAALPLTAARAQSLKTGNAGALVGRDEFPLDGIQLNAAYTHPLPRRAALAIQAYLTHRTEAALQPTLPESREGRKRAVERFARLINASVDEVLMVPSTMVGENCVARGLGLGKRRDKVVTDILHFEGSLYLYDSLAKHGLKHVIVPARDGRIDMNDMNKAITRGTRLVSVSYVSYINGFTHDLKALCDLAHSRGALVYADVIQAVGAVPLDVKATGLDFCAASGFKWMMGEQGAGFLFVRAGLLPKMKRFLFGYQQLDDVIYHAFPFEPKGRRLIEFTVASDMMGHFGVGTYANANYIGLAESLGLIEQLGVDKIVAHRSPMIRRLQEALPPKGFKPLTPAGSTAPLVSFAYKDADKRFGDALTKAKINAQLYPYRLRVSPSVYNTMDDIEALISALV
jgi:selenocysteine lyase/cysteine desulfurase